MNSYMGGCLGRTPTLESNLPPRRKSKMAEIRHMRIPWRVPRHNVLAEPVRPTYGGGVLGQMPSLACSRARTPLRSAGHDGGDSSHAGSTQGSRIDDARDRPARTDRGARRHFGWFGHFVLIGAVSGGSCECPAANPVAAPRFSTEYFGGPR